MVTKCYRVTRVLDGSPCSFGLYCLPSKHLMIHRLGQWDRPAVGRLFVWRTLELAKAFVTRFDDSGVCQVWLCEAENVKRLRRCTTLSTKEIAEDPAVLERYWLHGRPGHALGWLPGPLYTADAVRLVRQVVP